MDDQEFWRQFELAQLEKQEAFRAFILEQGRPDILAEYDAKMKDIRSGVDGAQSCWHSISDAQRRVLVFLGDGATLRQDQENPNRYFVRHRNGITSAERRATIRNLAARELLDWTGGAFTPEASAVLSDRGRFVLKYRQGSGQVP